MKSWNAKLTSCGEYLAKIDIRRGIFQADSLTVCDLYDNPDPNIKKSRIREYLEKWRKVEPRFVY